MEEEEKERGISIVGEPINKRMNFGLIGVACHGSVLSAAIRSIQEKEPNVIIVHAPEPPVQTIEINGIKYAKIEKDKPNYGHSMRGSMLHALGNVYEETLSEISLIRDAYGSNYKRKLPKGIDVIKEFGLIQNKQSNLSKWEREEVIRIFEKNFRLVNQ